MGGSVRAIVVAALLAPSLAYAQPSITFDGERYDKQFENRSGGDSVIEYVRPAEKLENWTKLVAVRHFSKLTDAKAAAANLARVVQQHNQQARSQVRPSSRIPARRCAPIASATSTRSLQRTSALRRASDRPDHGSGRPFAFITPRARSG